eukprot:CAMPEP_0170173282 /NCGR_PEP_ID=MMETSP0040_2-20121228/6550_1 /TAXON_ID=641309 /ORGANISM="Lotharella oceanica, Strain CCMP622" /LENGTH=183 /DNA_ID=CAMNT_0010414379 /DNA_START=57 /DNA_END=608 /DNA_ORIENTATION=-
MRQLQMCMCPFRTLCDWHYMDGPLDSEPVPEIRPFLRMIQQKDYHTWLRKTEDGSAYKGFDQAIKSVHTKLETLGDVDALLGFSQGALIASLVGNELYEKKQIQGVISVCGVDSKRNGDQFTVPSFHIIGKTDGLRERSKKLYDAFTGPKQMIEHATGHKFPSSKEKDIAVKLAAFCSSIMTT